MASNLGLVNAGLIARAAQGERNGGIMWRSDRLGRNWFNAECWGALAGSGAVIFAAIKAGDAVTNWKRQKMAERKMEIAERILTASYRAQAALARARNAFMWAHEEYAAREKLEENAAFLGNTAERQKRLVVAQAYFDRIDKVREDRLPLER